jgi:hypothetical protein
MAEPIACEQYGFNWSEAIRVYLGIFGPVGPVSENPELLVIPGFRDGTLGLWTTRTALSIHASIPL